VSARKFVAGVALASAGLAGGAVAASDYPPDAPPQRTALASSRGGDSHGQIAGPIGLQQPSGRLPATGSDTRGVVALAGSAVAAGTGLLVVTRRRRHAADSS